MGVGNLLLVAVLAEARGGHGHAPSTAGMLAWLSAWKAAAGYASPRLHLVESSSPLTAGAGAGQSQQSVTSAGASP